MALKQSQYLKLGQKLLPQQILLMKLLQLPTMALEERIKEELEANPALEEDGEQTTDDEFEAQEETDTTEELDENGDVRENEADERSNDVEIEDYMDAEELDSYKYEVVNKGPDEEARDFVVAEGIGFKDQLEQQLGLKDLSEKEYAIGLYLIGCLDEDGYVRRELELIVDDLAFNYNITTDLDEVTRVLKIIQSFDPPGIGARNLQECLMLQLERKPEKTRDVTLALEVIREHMDEFSKKHYDKIQKRLDIDQDELKDVIGEITHLNPRPGNSDNRETNYSPVVPDFIISVNDGKPELSINGRNLPDLKNSKYVQTPYGTFPLKSFFSESMSTESGEEVSSREIKNMLKDFIAAEDKRHPLTDDELCAMLNEKGYNIARRTVAKYREQLDIPVGRMRREL